MVEKFRKYFIENDGKIELGCAPTDAVEHEINKAMGLKFDSQVDFREFSNVDCGHDYDAGIQYEYSIRFGAFVEWENEFTLEKTFISTDDMHQDMLQFCFDELKDIIYSAYIEIVECDLEIDSGYDTLYEKWGLT